MSPHDLKWKHQLQPHLWTAKYANSITQEIYSHIEGVVLGNLPRKGDCIVAEVEHPTKPFVEYEVSRVLLNYDTHEAWVLLDAQHHREYRYYSDLVSE
jgi:hypothetical protein